MLGPNPRKVAGTPTSSTADFPPKTAILIQTQATEGGLMVKAMDEIFRHVEQADSPDSFKVINYIKRIFSFRNIICRCLIISLIITCIEILRDNERKKGLKLSRNAKYVHRAYFCHI